MMQTNDQISQDDTIMRLSMQEISMHI